MFFAEKFQRLRKFCGSPTAQIMFGILCACSLGLSAIGICIAVAIGNAFLALVMAIGLMFVPFWYVKTTATNYKKAISSELETALSIITTAYLRNEDIITSIEENVHYLNAPVKAVFENFISRIKLYNPDITAAILDMKTKIDNEVFHEWCDSLILCQTDRSLKLTLTPIVNKMSDMRVVNADFSALNFSPSSVIVTVFFIVVPPQKNEISIFISSSTSCRVICSSSANCRTYFSHCSYINERDSQSEKYFFRILFPFVLE